MNPELTLKAALIGSPDPGLLDAAARHATARRAFVATRALPAPEPAPAQGPREAGDAFVSTMGAILASPDAEPLVVEALRALADAGLVLPSRLIVGLLALAPARPAIAEALSPVLGPRGAWLARLDPEWLRGRPVAEPTAEDWDHGTLSERIAWLRHLRASDPQAGRQLVEGAGKEKAADRARFVAALEVGLGPGDEDFLEAQLGGRSKDVARAAAQLLARLPGSAFVDRALELARACLTLNQEPSPSGGETLTAVAPTQQDLTGRHLADLRQFAKGPAGRLRALVAVIPPARWAELGIPLAALAQGAVLDGELVDLRAPLTEAIQGTPDVAAARELSACLASPEIAFLLPPAERDEHLVRAVRALRGASVKAQGETWLHLAQVDGLRLPGEAAAEIIERVAESLASTSSKFDTAIRLVASAPAAAAEELIGRLAALGQHPKATPRLAAQIRAATVTLTLRRSIHQSLQPKEPR